MNVEIKTLVGDSCVTAEDGQRVYDEIYPKLAAGESVCLDFAGVRVFASPFFNFAIGQLLRDLEPDNLNELLKVEKLLPDGVRVWQLVVKNAKEYYRNPEAKEAVDEVLKQQAEDE